MTDVVVDPFLPSVSWNSLIMVMNFELSSLLEAALINESRFSIDLRMESVAVVPLILTGPEGPVVVIFLELKIFYSTGVEVLLAGHTPR